MNSRFSGNLYEGKQTGLQCDYQKWNTHSIGLIKMGEPMLCVTQSADSKINELTVRTSPSEPEAEVPEIRARKTSAQRKLSAAVARIKEDTRSAQRQRATQG